MSQSVEATPTKKLRLHKRTVVAVLFALLPWVLIAIPATPGGAEGTAGLSSNPSVYGWPFVHLESAESTLKGNSFNGRSYYRVKVPVGSDLSEDASEAATRQNDGGPLVQLNLRLHQDSDWRERRLRETGYWADWSNWPFGKTETYFTPRYVGLLLNLICVGLFAAVVAALCEHKIRRDQRLLKYSIASLFIVMAFLAACIACIVQIYRENAAQNAMQVLTREVGGTLWQKETQYEPRFPLIVSQLLNHGAYPWGAMETSRRVKSGKITVDIDRESDFKEIELVSRCARLTQHSVDLRVFDFNSDRQKMLHVMGLAKVTSLYLDVDAHDWFDDELSDGQGELDLAFETRNLEKLRLGLDRTISQKKQLEPFVGLPSLKWASISGLSKEGADFILETKTKWPNTMEFGFLDDVSEGLREKLEHEFKERLLDADSR